MNPAPSHPTKLPSSKCSCTSKAGVLRTPGPRGSKFGKQCSRACCLPRLSLSMVKASLPRPGGRCRGHTTRPRRCQALPSPHSRNPHKARRGRRRRGAGGLRPSARPVARRPPPFSASCSLSTSMAPRSPSPPAPPSAAVPGAAAPAPAPPTPAPALAHTPPHAGDRGGGSRREPGESERRSETDRARTSPSRYHQPSNMAPGTSARARSPQLSSSRPLRARAPTHAQERSRPAECACAAEARGTEVRVRSPRLLWRAAGCCGAEQDCNQSVHAASLRLRFPIRTLKALVWSMCTVVVITRAQRIHFQCFFFVFLFLRILCFPSWRIWKMTLCYSFF